MRLALESRDRRRSGRASLVPGVSKRRGGRVEGRRPRLSQRRGAPVNTFSLVSLQMNTAIEATYNINVLRRLPRTRSRAPAATPGTLSLSLSFSLGLFHPLAGGQGPHTEWPY